MDAQLRRVAVEAYQRGIELERQLIARAPQVWDQMDHMRATANSRSR